MFSYRHAFHAGNHADVLKHMVLIATMQYLTQKETALTVLDTHAGAGLYRLDGDYARKSEESDGGVLRLDPASRQDWAPAIQAYFDVLQAFNPSGQLRVYPGSPFITHHLMREQDRLKLFELHPTDARSLSGNVAQLEAGRQIAVLQEDGFQGVRKFLPPPSRRALLLCDPSYELKQDYARVAGMVTDALQRFVTGTYAIWYPIIARPEAHELPRRLRTLANKAQRSWLHATLTVHSGKGGAGLPGSGMFLINPPHVLHGVLKAALPQLVEALGTDRTANYTLDTHTV